MRKELSNLQKNLMTIIVGIFLVVAVFMIFNFTVGKSLKQLKEENTSLQAQYDMLKIYINDMPRYEQEIKDFTAKIDELVNQYDNTTNASIILRYYDDLLKKDGLKSSSLSYQDPEEVNQVQYSSNGVNNSYTLQQTLVQVSYESDYDNLLKFLGELDADHNNEYINNINLSFNESTDTDSSDSKKKTSKKPKIVISGSISIEKDTLKDNNMTEEEQNAEGLKTDEEKEGLEDSTDETSESSEESTNESEDEDKSTSESDKEKESEDKSDGSKESTSKSKEDSTKSKETETKKESAKESTSTKKTTNTKKTTTKKSTTNKKTVTKKTTTKKTTDTKKKPTTSKKENVSKKSTSSKKTEAKKKK